MSTLLFVSIVACSNAGNNLPGGLFIEEHLLSQAPATDLLNFEPVGSTQAEILVQHEEERSKVTPVNYLTIEGNPALSVPWDGNELVAVLISDNNTLEQIVQVSASKNILFTTSAGLPSPVIPLQGLWTYGRHWALEILYATPEVWTGQIFIDGDLVNQDKNYEEAFGFQMLSGRPFFFYQRDGQIGISYDGQEADLGYTSIPHYLCCAESVLNPIPAENMVAFFAQRNETWYYVEMGMFK